MTRSTDKAPIESQPPWDLIALLALAFIVFGWMALAVSYNPSHGAQPAFERLHAVALHQFRTLPWERFLHEMHTTHGPAFYALVGSLDLPAKGVRAVGLAMHLVSTLVLLQAALQFGVTWWRAALLSAAFFASPFQFGPALWGHPETLATLLAVVALGAAVHPQGPSRRQRALGAVLLPLTVLVHQAGAALVAASCVDDLRARRHGTLAIKLGMTVLLLCLLVRVWDGLTPPSAGQVLQWQPRALLAALALLVLGLHGLDRAGWAAGWGDRLRRFALLAPAVVLVYAVAPPFAGGGFVFSRLDALEAAWLPAGWGVPLASPLLIAAVLAWCWASLRRQPAAAAQIGICALVLGTGETLYLKDVDFFFWPLLLMRLVRRGRPAPGAVRGLVGSAALWTGVCLTLATWSYRPF